MCRRTRRALTAWLLDQGNDYKATRKNIAAVKTVIPRILNDIASRALQIHGSLGISHDMPFAEWIINSFHVALADGPTEVHKVTVAREVLKDVQPAKGPFPDYLKSEQARRAREKFGIPALLWRTSCQESVRPPSTINVCPRI